MSTLAPVATQPVALAAALAETPAQRRSRRLAQSATDDAQRIFFEQGLTAAHEHLAYVETGPAPLTYRRAFAEQMEALLGAFTE